MFMLISNEMFASHEIEHNETLFLLRIHSEIFDANKGKTGCILHLKWIEGEFTETITEII